MRGRLAAATLPTVCLSRSLAVLAVLASTHLGCGGGGGGAVGGAGGGTPPRSLASDPPPAPKPSQGAPSPTPSPDAASPSSDPAPSPDAPQPDAPQPNAPADDPPADDPPADDPPADDPPADDPPADDPPADDPPADDPPTDPAPAGPADPVERVGARSRVPYGRAVPLVVVPWPPVVHAAPATVEVRIVDPTASTLGQVVRISASAGAFSNGQRTVERAVQEGGPGIRRDGAGAVTFVEQLQVPADAPARIELEAALLLGGGMSVGRGFVLVRGAQVERNLRLEDLRVPTASDDSLGVETGDVNGDGHLDVVVALNGSALGPGGLKILLNDGTGHFTDTTDALVPAELRGFRRGSYVALGDIDGDGDLEIFLSLWGDRSDVGVQSRLLLNEGGRFVDVSGRLPRHTVWGDDAAMVDIDGDGDVDIVHSVRWFEAERYHHATYVYLNDGAGSFPTERVLPLGGSIDVGDLNGDGTRDLVIAGGSGSPIWFVTPEGLVAGADLGIMGAGPALGDLNGDGFLDLVLQNSKGDRAREQEMQPRLFLGDGRGNLSPVAGFPFVANPAVGRATLLLDVDGDGHLDVFVAYYDTLNSTRSVQNRLFLSDGAGRFADVTTQALPARSDRTGGAALGDFDGDGTLDIYVANRHQQQDYVLMNRAAHD